MNSAHRKTVALLSVFLVIITVYARNINADDLSDYRASEVLSHVTETYSRVYSAGGRIIKTFEINADRNTIDGRFAVLRPDKLYLEYTGEDRQITVNNGETLSIYSPDQNRGLFQHTSEMNFLERFVLGPEPFFGNIFQLMGDKFNIELADMVSGNLILKASPLTPLQINFILIAVDPKTWTIRAVETFDKSNTLVSQTKYLEFKSVGDTLYFPSKTATSTIVGDDIMVETLEFTRLRLNLEYSNEWFEKPGDSNTEWIPVNSVKQNKKPE